MKVVFKCKGKDLVKTLREISNKKELVDLGNQTSSKNKNS